MSTLSVLTYNIAGGLQAKIDSLIDVMQEQASTALFIQEHQCSSRTLRTVTQHMHHDVREYVLFHTPAIMKTAGLSAGVAICLHHSLSSRVIQRRDTPGRAISLLLQFRTFDVILTCVYGVTSGHHFTRRARTLLERVTTDITALKRSRRTLVVCGGDFNIPLCDAARVDSLFMGRTSLDLVDPLTGALDDRWTRQSHRDGHTILSAVDTIMLSGDMAPQAQCGVVTHSASLSLVPSDHRPVKLFVSLWREDPPPEGHLPTIPPECLAHSFSSQRYSTTRSQDTLAEYNGSFHDVMLVTPLTNPDETTIDEHWQNVREVYTAAAGRIFPRQESRPGELKKQSGHRKMPRAERDLMLARRHLGKCARLLSRGSALCTRQIQLCEEHDIEVPLQMNSAQITALKEEIILVIEHMGGELKTQRNKRRKQQIRFAVRLRQSLFFEGRPGRLARSMHPLSLRPSHPSFFQLLDNTPVLFTDPKAIMEFCQHSFWHATAPPELPDTWPLSMHCAPAWAKALYHCDTVLSDATAFEDPTWGSIMDPITDPEWSAMWNMYSRDTAPGPSGLSYLLLLAAPSQVLHSLRALLNRCLSERCIPEEWGRAVIYPIPKTNDANDVSKMRPISMMEDALKLLTGLLANRFQHLARRNGTPSLIHSMQHAFQWKRGTFEAGTLIRSAIEDAVEYGRELYMLDFDIEGAYNAVTHNSMELAYNELGLPLSFRHLMRRIDSFSISEVITPTGLSHAFRIGKGVRQGDPLSCMRFVMLLNGLFKHLQSRPDLGYVIGRDTPAAVNLSLVGFADDTSTLSNSPTGIVRLGEMQLAFLRYHNMRVNTKKSHLLTTHPISIVLHDTGSAIALTSEPIENHFRYLGFYLSPQSAPRIRRPMDILNEWLPYLHNKSFHYHEKRWLWNNVLLPRASYPLLHMNPTESEWRLLESKSRISVLHSLNCPRSLCKGSVHHSSLGMGIMSLRENVDRLRTMAVWRLLQRPQEPAQSAVLSRLDRAMAYALLPVPDPDTNLHPPLLLHCTPHHRWSLSVVNYMKHLGLSFGDSLPRWMRHPDTQRSNKLAYNKPITLILDDKYTTARTSMSRSNLVQRHRSLLWISSYCTEGGQLRCWREVCTSVNEPGVREPHWYNAVIDGISRHMDLLTQAPFILPDLHSKLPALSPIASLALRKRLWKLPTALEATVATDGSFDPATGRAAWALTGQATGPSPLSFNFGGCVQTPSLCTNTVYVTESLAVAFSLQLPIKRIHLLIDNASVVRRLHSQQQEVERHGEFCELPSPMSPCCALWSYIRLALIWRHNHAHSITVTKVKSHVSPAEGGHSMNARADMLANLYRDHPENDATPFRLRTLTDTPLPMDSRRQYDSVLPPCIVLRASVITRTLQDQQHLRTWRADTNTRQNRLLLQSSPQERDSASSLRDGHRWFPFRFHTRFLTLTLPTPQYNFHNNSGVDPKCPLCPAQHCNMQHVFLECPATRGAATRAALRGHNAVSMVMGDTPRVPHWPHLIRIIQRLFPNTTCELETPSHLSLILPHTAFSTSTRSEIHTAGFRISLQHNTSPEHQRAVTHITKAIYTLYSPEKNTDVPAFCADEHEHLLISASLLTHIIPLRHGHTHTRTKSLAIIAGLHHLEKIPLVEHDTRILRARLEKFLKQILFDFSLQAWQTFCRASH